MELAPGIAHVSFSSGGIFLPARDPYDRQTLIEHVRERVRSKGQVQVLVDQQRWMVRPTTRQLGTSCVTCGEITDVACYSQASGSTCCTRCAFGGPLQPQPSRPVGWRQAS